MDIDCGILNIVSYIAALLSRRKALWAKKQIIKVLIKN